MPIRRKTRGKSRVSRKKPRKASYRKVSPKKSRASSSKKVKAKPRKTVKRLPKAKARPKKKVVSHSKKSTRKLKASQVKSKKVQKRQTRIKSKPINPNRVDIGSSNPTHNVDGTNRFVPNTRSNPFQVLPRLNPDKRTTLNPHKILLALSDDIEREIECGIKSSVIQVEDHGGFIFHEYRWEFLGRSVSVDELKALYNLAYGYFTPHYRSLTALVAQVGFEHEERNITAVAWRSLAATMHLTAAFSQVAFNADRWDQQTNYRAICGIAIHVKAPDWWQPADKQKLEHKPIRSKAKRVTHKPRKAKRVTHKPRKATTKSKARGIKRNPIPRKTTKNKAIKKKRK